MPKNNVSVKLKIINTSNEKLTKNKQDAFQMESWDFPETIDKNETIELTATFKEGEDINLSEDFGEVEYKTDETLSDLKIRAFWPFFKIDISGTINVDPKGFIEYSEGEVVTLTIS